MDKLIIRRDRKRDLILYRTSEKVYFLSHFGQMIDNSVEYESISDHFNRIVERGEV